MFAVTTMLVTTFMSFETEEMMLDPKLTCPNEIMCSKFWLGMVFCSFCFLVKEFQLVIIDNELSCFYLKSLLLVFVLIDGLCTS